MLDVDIPGVPDCDCLHEDTVADAFLKMPDDVHPRPGVEFIPLDKLQYVLDIDVGCDFRIRIWLMMLQTKRGRFDIIFIDAASY